MIPFKYNLRNLFVRWRTTLLTAFGFTLIVALLVVMLGFVQGITDLAGKSGPLGNVIIMREGATDELFSDMPVSDNLFLVFDSRHPEVIVDEVVGADGKPQRLPRASPEIYSIANQEIPPKSESELADFRLLQIRGIYDPAVAGRVHGLKLREGGRWFDKSGGEVVMGSGIARLLGVQVGSEFAIRPTLKWTVVGILDSQGSPFDSEIWAKIEDVGRYFGKDNVEKGQRFYTSIVVATPDAKQGQTFAESVKTRTNLEIGARLESKYYEELSKGNALFLFAAMFIAVVMAIGGMFGLMNTMFAAVSQRIKDIGVLRVLGFSKGQILVSFLLESMLLALIGGGLGIALGFLANGLEQTGMMNSGGGGGKTIVFQITVNAWVVSVALAFTLVMGLIGGLLPSFTAMRMKLLDTLR